MKTILTGIQSSGIPHIGNYFGAIKPAIDLSKDNNTILFIADIHSLTSIKNPVIRKQNTYAILASLISLGFDYKKNILYKQSDVPQTCELSFYLSCFTQYNTLLKSHAFREKCENTNDITVGLFTYPVLMSADILLYDADLVPVGKDQLQHLEITRTLANKLNSDYGKIFNSPEGYIIDNLKTIIGTDGRKMSKSYNNCINPFDEEKKLRKSINKIITSSSGINDPKDYSNCNLFNLCSLFLDPVEIEELKKEYEKGIPYSSVKGLLFNKIMEYFKEPRSRYNEIINDYNLLDSILEEGKIKANIIAENKIKLIRKTLGF